MTFSHGRLKSFKRTYMTLAHPPCVDMDKEIICEIIYAVLVYTCFIHMNTMEMRKHVSTLKKHIIIFT